MDSIKNLFKISNFNIYTILSLLFIIAGISFYIYWGIRYNVWIDIGIYSITIVFVFSGVVGFFLSLMDKKEED